MSLRTMLRNAALASSEARTSGECFLIATSESGAQWRLNADHVQRWMAGAAAQQQRLREDLKAERRFPREMREGITERMAFSSGQRKRRLDSWLHEASAQLVNWTKRQHASELVWDDTFRSAFPQFPWYLFSSRIEDKCKMAGIEFVKASEGAALESPEPLAEQVTS